MNNPMYTSLEEAATAVKRQLGADYVYTRLDAPDGCSGFSYYDNHDKYLGSYIFYEMSGTWYSEKFK